MKKLDLIIVAVLCVCIISCAKKGRPSGGPKDITPPKMVIATPENYSTNFSENEIKILFNEYVKLNDINKQLIISPPLKIKPLISPQSGASKYVKIKIYDTLQPNTTYSFNFGKSIVDNNEGNPYQYFKYVFSTGETIDSLQLNGSVRDALAKTTDDFVSVMLYEIDSTYTDSTVYNTPPRYITNTLDSATTFQFENLKAGTYQLLALKEESDNFMFNQKTDKIAFKEELITVPSKESHELLLFKEIENYKALRPKHERLNRIKFRYEGQAVEPIGIQLISDANIRSMVTKPIDNDTLNYWFKPSLEVDSLKFIMRHEQQIDTFKVRMRKKVKADSLSFKPVTRGLTLDGDYQISSTTPISQIDNAKINVLNQDSIALPFTTSIEKLTNIINLKFEKAENEKYTINILPEAFTDFFEATNDTLVYRTTTKKLSAYGNIKVTLNNAPKTPLIVQLVTSKGEVSYEKFGTGVTVFDFVNVDPSTYNLRVIFDDNNNQKYDTGHYLKKLQPERVSYHPDAIEIRANWDVEERFTLK
ncbi:MAG: Ig-like domain-containing protein [Flavobacteriaceae bacterium]